MKSVAEANNLEYDKDVKLLTIGTAATYNQYLLDNMNKTRVGVLFCVDSYDYGNTTIPCNFEYMDETIDLYTIIYNVSNTANSFLTTFSDPLPIDYDLLRLKMSLDNSYLNHYAKLGNVTIPKILMDTVAYPSTPNRFIVGADLVASYGPFYFFFPPIITFVVVLLEIIREKDMKLRKVLIN